MFNKKIIFKILGSLLYIEGFFMMTIYVAKCLSNSLWIIRRDNQGTYFVLYVLTYIAYICCEQNVASSKVL